MPYIAHMKSESDSALGLSGKRRVGVEIEFGALDVKRTADIVRERFGGTYDETSAYQATVEGTEFGDFKIELDWSWAHKTVDNGGIVDQAKDLLTDLGKEVAPTEVVAPPIAADRLDAIDKLACDLSAAGAQGTRSGLLAGFGVHLNPEVFDADLAADPLRRVLQAYLLNAAELRASIRVDATRALLPFVEPFPEDYLSHVLDPDYAPDLAGLIDDYLRFNPTRNRELDMLPIFTLLDESRVRSALADPKISTRPTFHWRLPNTDFENPDWSISRDWQRWLEIEHLAVDDERLLDRLKARAREQKTSKWPSLF